MSYTLRTERKKSSKLGENTVFIELRKQASIISSLLFKNASEKLKSVRSLSIFPSVVEKPTAQ